MRYLFFDIECADGYNICAFGYVITDYNFNVLLKEDILRNVLTQTTVIKKALNVHFLQVLTSC